MSELKAVHAFDVYEAYTKTGDDDAAQVYLKSEADKVIAEKDETIDELKERNDELQKATDSAWSKVNAMYDELRHHKYKRCLAMAQQLFNERTYWHYRYDDWGDRGYDRKYKWGKVKWCGKWGRKWLAIAEKFKEAK